ncbi:MAG TPA: helix-turn-helix transcriptional regulator [Stackebrandtia sp.]|jgi:DNA-binding PadR family transcriptional regulator|uniref:PadR family transcriptional regulator n=1 Tax=Stackebrandtia sp. TaxID=2023065 RepID=UPI002D4CEA8E|nr:helix-turn-helix transcriptional regulator [Stackebrandtia sp.]HZE41031.1 helix-turn-helix transcriptional regulator [Stackebrandtia sp.]
MRAETLRGHLDAMLLSVLESEPLHGYAIIEALKQRSDGELDVPTGTVYPALRRLERAGFLRSDWSNVGGRERRTYALTGAGKRELTAQRGQWRRVARTVTAFLGN